MPEPKRQNEEIRLIAPVDLRSLALLRIGIGAIVIIDLLIRSSDLTLFYSDKGALPRNSLYSYYWNNCFFSLHNFSGNSGYEVFLFIAAIVAAVFLILGFETRIATIISWILMISLHNRNPLLLQAGDDLLRLLLFWGIFLPWHQRYSLDVSRMKKKGSWFESNRYSGLSVLGYVLLIFSVYFFSGLEKNADEWRTEGTALYYAFNLDMIAYPTAKYLLQFPQLLKWITRAIVYFEIFGPVLLLIPGKKGRLRMIFIVLVVMLHTMIASTLLVGLFWMIGITSVIGLIPTDAMNWLERNVKRIFFRKAILSPEKDLSRETSDQIFSGKNPKLVNALILLVIFYQLAWNITGLPFFPFKLSEAIKAPAYVFRLDQNWGVFAPAVFKDDGWFVYEGITPSKISIDLRQKGEQTSFAKPKNEVFNYKNDRWRKFSENYLFIKNAPLRPPFCHYLLNEWNVLNDSQKIDSLSVIFMKEITPPPGQPAAVTKEILCTCSSERE